MAETATSAEVKSYLKQLVKEYPQRNSIYRANVFEKQREVNEGRRSAISVEIDALENLAQESSQSILEILHDQSSHVLITGPGYASTEELMDHGLTQDRMHFIDMDTDVKDYHVQELGIDPQNFTVIPRGNSNAEGGAVDYFNNSFDYLETKVDLVVGNDMPAEVIIAAIAGLDRGDSIFSDNCVLAFTSTQPARGPWDHWQENKMVQTFVDSMTRRVNMRLKKIHNEFDSNDMLIEEQYGYVISIKGDSNV